jgi:flavin reductase (DIM6/NTAB) family NADH-FMN oxidoreductase RutF
MTELLSRSPVEAIELRRAMSAVPAGVVLLTTRLDGADHAMTASSLTSVSLSPPLVLVCVNQSAAFHAALSVTGAWGVSVLDAQSVAWARRLSLAGRPLTDQLRAVPHVAGPATGAPLITTAISTLECRTVASHDAGDHSIFVGLVVASAAADEKRRPLVHHRGAYATIAELGP